ncbi:hypothetical protein HYH02_014766 [Chlamydomonas schloesseri]|uniref:Uncharacterized protein n=1 Tax=Chlamydomonas schloesseri TaxID=2026947 RepID=A0A835SVP4_9CHLO|nr:hypothetical protein HYH02_014766 [Chlamydomonas schloesseri]|eukprot:KAG2426726.1 hypothetical protein HYH02_014766 [Chlamydomonas schloesseri]
MFRPQARLCGALEPARALARPRGLALALARRQPSAVPSAPPVPGRRPAACHHPPSLDAALAHANCPLKPEVLTSAAAAAAAGETWQLASGCCAGAGAGLAWMQQQQQQQQQQGRQQQQQGAAQPAAAGFRPGEDEAEAGRLAALEHVLPLRLAAAAAAAKEAAEGGYFEYVYDAASDWRRAVLLALIRGGGTQ